MSRIVPTVHAERRGLLSDRSYDRLFLISILVAAAVLRCYEIGLPYLKLHETGFQETLALNHLEHGILENRFLSVMAVVDSVKYYHVSHPPLLQWTLALTFSLLGSTEVIARLAILPFSLGSILLVHLVASKHLGARVGRIAACFMTFSLLASYFGRIVNFEVVAQFFVLFFYALFLRYRERPGLDNLLLLAGAFFLGCLSDWPFYFVLAGVVLFSLLDRDRPRWLRDFGVSCAFLGLGFLMVGLYAGYQDLVSGNMVLAGHGRNRSAPALLMDPAFYELLLGRLFEFAPFLTVLAPVGLVIGIARDRKAVWFVLPLLFVPLAYVTIFAQAAKAHAWALYYFAAPMAILAALALERALGARHRLKAVACGVLVIVLSVMNVRFHETAKRGIFSDLYNLSAFLEGHLGEDSVVFSAIFSQVSYYLDGEAEVLFPFAKGDLGRHSYDCYVLDRLFENPFRRQDVRARASESEVRPVLESSRYRLVCDPEVVANALLLDHGPVSHDRLVRLGREVHVAQELAISRPESLAPFRLSWPGSEDGGPAVLYFEIALVATPDLELRVWQARDGRRTELLRRAVDAEDREGEWRSFQVELPGTATLGGDLEFAVVGLSVPGSGSRVYLGDPRIVGADREGGGGFLR